MDSTSLSIFIPGRLCLFGEHSDWAGRYTLINSDIQPGHAIVTGLDLGIYATAQKSARFSISSFDGQGNPLSFSCEMDGAALIEFATKNEFFSYACGVAAYIFENYRVGGVDINVDRVTLPIKKGLSSSAAICVLVTRAFNELYKLNMSTNGEMHAAYRGEMITGSRCGRLDQACAYGMRPVSITFDGDDIRVDKLKVGANLYFVYADLMSQKNTRKILADLNKAYPFAQNQIEERVHEALGPDNLQIITKAAEAIELGDAERVGALMTQAQQIFDEKVAPASPDALLSPRLHSFLEDERARSLSYGGKGVGSQGDGMIQFIARDKKSQKELAEYLNSQGLQAYCFMLPSGDPVRKAVIPIAGMGTRMYPATCFIKKCFLPIVDHDGVVKPVLFYLLEELDKAGVEEIILVVGEEELPEFTRLLKSRMPEHVLDKMPEKIKKYDRFLARIIGHIRFAVQKEQRGLGHAVYQAAHFIGNEPVLLLLGDFIFRSNLSSNCAQQTINAYHKAGGKPIIAVKPVSLENVIHYGIITGRFDNRRDYLMTVTDMVEKPTVEMAKEDLGIHTPNGTLYYATFGQYVLTPQVFHLLEKEIQENDGSREVDLTNVLKETCKLEGATGVLIDGESYDVGIPNAYYDTFTKYGKC